MRTATRSVSKSRLKAILRRATDIEPLAEKLRQIVKGTKTRGERIEKLVEQTSTNTDPLERSARGVGVDTASCGRTQAIQVPQNRLEKNRSALSKPAASSNPITACSDMQVYFAAGTQMASAIEKSTPATSVRIDMYCSPAFLSGLADTVSRY